MRKLLTQQEEVNLSPSVEKAQVEISCLSHSMIIMHLYTQIHSYTLQFIQSPKRIKDWLFKKSYMYFAPPLTVQISLVIFPLKIWVH